MDTRLLTTDEAADRLQISARFLRKITQAGELPAVRIGRSVRFDPADLAAYIESRKEGGNRE